MNHFCLKIVALVAKLICALAAINVGLAPFDYNVFQMDFFIMHPNVVAPICYVILAAGLVSLAFFVMAVMGHCGCNSGSCKSSNCK